MLDHVSFSNHDKGHTWGLGFTPQRRFDWLGRFRIDLVDGFSKRASRKSPVALLAAIGSFFCYVFRIDGKFYVATDAIRRSLHGWRWLVTVIDLFKKITDQSL